MKKLVIIPLFSMFTCLGILNAQTGIYTVSGNLILHDNASTEIQLKNTSGAGIGNDQLNVIGNLSLNGPLIILLDGYIPNSMDHFQIASFTGTLTGNFTSISWPSSMLEEWDIDYGVLIPGKVTIFGSQNPLPVVLTEFNGIVTDQGNELFWRTESELNFDYFEIQWSQDGLKWSEVGRVKAIGNSSTQQTYNFLHTEVGNGLNYYRLNQIENDGKTSFSKLISLRHTQNNELVKLYPNPLCCTINFDNAVDNVIIVNMEGKKVFEGRQVGYSLDISYLRPGTYFVSVNESKNFNQILVIN